MIKVWAITGYDGSGKSTLAKKLGDYLSLDASDLSLANPIRQDLSTIYPNVNFWEKPTPHWMRCLLIGHAEWKKETFGKDIWLNYLQDFINQKGFNSFTIGDMRFSSEVDWVHSLNGRVIYLGEQSNAYELDYCYDNADYHFGPKPDFTAVLETINN